MTISFDSSTTDGRSLRRSRNREAVLDAVIASFEAGDIDPSIDDVAQRAGVSNRSIYRYFDHRDALMRAAVSHAMRRIIPEMTFGDVGVGPFTARVRAFVEHRMRMYHRTVQVTRAAKLAAVNEPIVAEEFEVGRFMLRQQILDHFAAEFEPLRPTDRNRALVTAEMAFQFENLEFLWAATDHRDEEMRAILIEHLDLSLGRLRQLQLA